MKSAFVVLVAALLCAERVSSLACFSCENAESNLECLSIKSCDSKDKYCITKYFGGGMGENHKQSISKGCSQICPQAGVDLGIMAFSVKCCESTLCNTSGAISVRGSHVMLLVATVASLLCVFGAKL
ncbi:lymphocyte antigen 6E-like [Varanus komodoensis]|uniref:UPAR/Ly6 domain-containing protein n=1 Tax=Varanus komodoensis TaxID=61221 RepID=A0A8D2LRH4_VARKO|nr:lymphocyte antigen 6E-like [Varanus komodoensis]